MFICPHSSFGGKEASIKPGIVGAEIKWLTRSHCLFGP